MQPSEEARRQQRYFDTTRNQYPQAAILEPPLHTTLEIQGVLERLHDLRVGGEQIVDFGSGTGRLSIPLARAGHSVLAVDVSERSLDALTATARELGPSAVETAAALPKHRRFPTVVGTDVLHHVNLDEYLTRIHDVLDEG